MKKIKQKWHIIFLSTSITLFSLLCWSGFAKSAMNTLRNYAEKRGRVQEIDVEERLEEENIAVKYDTELQSKLAVSGEPKKGISDKIEQYAKLLDGIMSKFEKGWYGSMYRKSALSKIDSVATYYVTGGGRLHQVRF